MGNQGILNYLDNFTKHPNKDGVKYPQHNGKLIIIAGGRCVWEDLSKIRINTEEMDIMAVNDVGMHLPYKVKHWYSNDNVMLPKWLAARRPKFRRDPPYDEGQSIATHSCNPGVKYHWQIPGHGTSGLNAVYVALLMGYDDIIICGMPLDDTGHYFDAPWETSNFTREAPDRDTGIRYWSNAAQHFEGKVKAVSGRLLKILPRAI